MYQKIFRPLFFRFDPELAHNLTINLLHAAGSFALSRAMMQILFNAHSQYITSPTKEYLPTPKYNTPTTLFGLRFLNPLGLAAGYDKDGLAWRGLETLGFGHIEVGTVTPRPQEGNPKPRIFRIPKEQALINRMGFPGRGADFVAKQLLMAKKQRSSTLIGVNIGKNKDTPNEEAANDYLYLLEKFSPLTDYLTVNISSPNTVGLRRLQVRDNLEKLLKQLKEKRLTLPDSPPILVKLAPDLSDDELDDALSAITSNGMEGVIATNTTISRKGLHSPLCQEIGGLSGSPLKSRSLDVVKRINAKTGGQLPIIGVGGISNPEDAKAMLDAGASLIQLYTSLIYAGPGLVKQILQEL